MKLIIINRAAIAALFFLSLMSLAATNAEPTPQKSETHKDIISKAYNLSLQSDRQQAINILLAAHKKENRPQPILELKKACIEISHLFFSDKAQQSYETGLSLIRSDLTQAINKLNEALRAEPENTAIVIDLSRLLIAKGECSSSIDLILKNSKLISIDEELKLVLAQAYVCQDQWSDYAKLLDANEIKNSALQKYWLTLEIERLIHLRSYQKSQEILNILKKTDPNYIENHYWSWRIGQTLKKQKREDAQRYIVLCKNIKPKQLRQNIKEPMFCRRTQEVELELKAVNGNRD